MLGFETAAPRFSVIEPTTRLPRPKSTLYLSYINVTEFHIQEKFMYSHL